jgi:hypothetical protein
MLLRQISDRAGFAKSPGKLNAVLVGISFHRAFMLNGRLDVRLPVAEPDAHAVRILLQAGLMEFAYAVTSK